jgi:hypothetical protein
MHRLFNPLCLAQQKEPKMPGAATLRGFTPFRKCVEYSAYSADSIMSFARASLRSVAAKRYKETALKTLDSARFEKRMFQLSASEPALRTKRYKSISAKHWILYAYRTT